jgi:hypothetical protein
MVNQMFVVYRVRDGKTVGVYDTERAAKTRASKNNRELVMDLLKGEDDRSFRSMDGWDYCAFVDYAPHMRRFFKSKSYYYS